MLTLKQYAEQKEISYEAVRVQVKRYENDLKQHIKVKDRTKYLDDYAIQFLDEKRKSSPVTVFNQTKNDELEETKAENKQLLIKIAELQQKLLDSQTEIIKLKDENTKRDQKIIELTEQKTEMIEQKVASMEEQRKGILYRLFHRQ